jgi:hypothetical protein
MIMRWLLTVTGLFITSQASHSRALSSAGVPHARSICKKNICFFFRKTRSLSSSSFFLSFFFDFEKASGIPNVKTKPGLGLAQCVTGLCPFIGGAKRQSRARLGLPPLLTGPRALCSHGPPLGGPKAFNPSFPHDRSDLAPRRTKKKGKKPSLFRSSYVIYSVCTKILVLYVYVYIQINNNESIYIYNTCIN